MYDMKPDAPVEIRGEFKPIQTNVPGFDVCELMPLQAKIADKLAVVRNLQMTTSSHNYREITSGYVFGPFLGGTPRPAFGSVVSKLRPGKDLPAFVNLWTTEPSAMEDPVYTGRAHAPFHPTGPALENMALRPDMSLERMDSRKELMRTFDGLKRDMDSKGEMAGYDAFAARAIDIVSSSKARDAFDISKEPDRIRAQYGISGGMPTYNANYGIYKQFLTARRLVEAGVSVVSLQAFGQWDTHASNFPTLRSIVPVVDRGLAALVSDLHDRGLDKDVAVVMWGEFGRGPRIYSLNGNVPGRDHHGPANFAVFAGGGFQTGQVIGATDPRGERPRTGLTRPQNVLATLYTHLGIDPGAAITDGTGRPIHLLDHRDPIAELL
jgi:hypothetical protein